MASPVPGSRAAHNPWLVLVFLSLGFFMIFAMWLFPEVKREETAGGVRRDAKN